MGSYSGTGFNHFYLCKGKTRLLSSNQAGFSVCYSMELNYQNDDNNNLPVMPLKCKMQNENG